MAENAKTPEASSNESNQRRDRRAIWPSSFDLLLTGEFLSPYICVSLRLRSVFVSIRGPIRVHSRLFVSGGRRGRRGRRHVAEGEPADNRFQIDGRFRIRNRAARAQILRRRTRGERHEFVAN